MREYLSCTSVESYPLEGHSAEVTDRCQELDDCLFGCTASIGPHVAAASRCGEDRCSRGDSVW